MASQAEMATRILAERKQQESGEVPKAVLAQKILAERKAAEPTFLESAGQVVSDIGSAIGEAFTGSERTTESSEALPELAFSGLLSGEDTGTVAKISPALLTTLDPQETAQILQANFPNIGIIQDEKGNLIAENRKTGAISVINKPGLSPTDVLQGAGLGAEFFPASKLGSGVQGVVKKMSAVGAGTGGTEAINQALQSQAGGEFDVGDVGIATAGGAVFEGIFQGLAAVFPAFRETVKAAGGKINDTIRQTFKEQAKKEGRNVDEITDDVIEQVLFPETAALKGEKEFGIGLTKGQRSGVQQELRTEDDLLTGRVGTSKSQETMVGQREATAQQAREAAGQIQQDIATGAPVVTTQQEAGGLVKQGIRNIEEAEQAAVTEAFDAVGDAAMKPEAFVKMFQATKDSIKGIDFPVTSETPATTSLLKQINSAQKLFKKEGVTIKPQHIQRIEQIRRSIGAQIKTAANPTDKRNLATMKRSYDNFVDNAMKDALFEGDQGALDALKSSRTLFKEYATKFRAQTKKTPSGRTISDKEGNFVEQIIDGDPTDIQTINSLFGTGNTFGNAAAKKMAVKFKTILGEESPEWSSVRQAGLKRLIRTMADGKTISGQQTRKAIEGSMAKNGELMNEIFSPDEISTLRRFAAQVERSQPEIIKGVAQPSGTGLVVKRALEDAMSKITTMFGFATGNPAFIVAGKGISVGSTLGAEKTAKQAVKPFSKIINARPGLVTGATVGTIEANQ